MPWLETDPVTERKRFIMEWLSGELAVAELCRRHEISRKAGYKWIARYEREGPEGLEDRSRRPGDCPWAAEPDVIEEAIRIRYSRRQPLGARKVRPQLVGLYADRDVPCERTLHRHFVRRGLVKKRRRSRKRPHPGKPTAPFDVPNSIWSADFKGQFKTRDGVYCHPLTVQDGFSRYLLACQGLAGTTFVDTKRVFTRLFHEFGLPTRIRTDNGTPFASWPSAGSLSSRSGGSSSGSCPTSSSRPHPSRMVGMSVCTGRSRPIPPSRRPVTDPLSSDASTSSGPTSTMYGLTSPSTTIRRPPFTGRHPDRCPPSSARRSTPRTSRSAKSRATAESGGTPSGSTSHIYSAETTSGSRRSPQASGPSSSGPSRSAGST